MKVYHNKKRWKFLLYGSAAVAFVIIVYYSNLLINNISREERNRIEIWADAVSYKAELVNYTEQFFDKIRIEEGKRASIFAKALRKVDEASLEEDITFYSDIISSNSTIPSIVVFNGKIDCAVNIDTDMVSSAEYIWQIENYQNIFDSVKIHHDKDQYITVYYQESQIYSNLRVVLNNLIESFFQEVVINSASVPVVVTDQSEKNVIAFGNIDSAKVFDPKVLPHIIEKMKSENEPIKIQLPENQTCYVFYEESSVLKQLRLFPFLQFFIVILFAVIAYLLFSVARKSEQNQVWVGMSKETAHQLGTPISSLMAWNEILKEQNVDQTVITEINKDVLRLETIAQRFSKIGSVPELKDENLVTVIQEFILYLQTRLSGRVTIEFMYPEKEIILPLNRYLFEWVIENLCKNAVDAMNGRGTIFIEIIEEPKVVHVDIQDTGKGIHPKKHKDIFTPGYTSKERGWGLGLTLAKRIIKEYHKGKLFVKSSTQDIGTVMRITLQRFPSK